MGRRLRAFKRLFNQVVRVTRTAFIRCLCGEEHAIVRDYVVPASALFRERENLFGAPDEMLTEVAQTVTSGSHGSVTSPSVSPSSSCHSLGEVWGPKIPTPQMSKSRNASNSHYSTGKVPNSKNPHSHKTDKSPTPSTSSPSLSASVVDRQSCVTNSSSLLTFVSPLQSRNGSSFKSTELLSSRHSNRSASSQQQASASSTGEISAAEKKPSVIFSAHPKWAAVLPTSLQVIRKFDAGAVGQVELVSSGANKFVRKKMTSSNVPVSEAGVTIEVQCQYVVKLLACFTQGNATIFYFPYYSMGDLQYWMQKDGSGSVFNEDMSVWTALQILAGIREIHKKGVIHMDIKPSNVLISNRGYPVITDFGGAVRTSDPCTAYCFTEAYMCPEFILDDNKLVKDGMADLWGAGITFYEMMTNDLPEFSNSTGAGKILKLKLSGFSATAKDFLAKVLSMDPSDRLGYEGGVEDLLDHPLFADSEWMDTLIDRVLGIDSPLLHRLLELEGD